MVIGSKHNSYSRTGLYWFFLFASTNIWELNGAESYEGDREMSICTKIRPWLRMPMGFYGVIPSRTGTEVDFHGVIPRPRRRICPVSLGMCYGHHRILSEDYIIR